MQLRRGGPLGAKQLDSIWVPPEQRPRSLWGPEHATSSGDEAMEVVELAKIELDAWQEFTFRESLGERADGTWAALQVGIEVPRQNGKGGILEARQLAGLFLFEEEQQIHSAHEFSTSLAAFNRLKQLVEETPDFDREVMSIKGSHGEEGIYLRGGREIRFRTRTNTGARGLTGRETLYLDEAMIIKSQMMASLMPILSARPNPQLWFTGSTVDQVEHEHGVVFARLRERGLRGGDPRVAWFGWGWAPTTKGEEEDPLLPDKAEDLLDDEEFWQRSNPAFGIRITKEFIEEERKTLDTRDFAVERLGIGDWPATEEQADELFSRKEWAAILDREAKMAETPALAIDVSPDRATASISTAGKVADGKTLIELVERRRGTGWVVKRVVELVDKHRIRIVVVDGRASAASLIDDLNDALSFEVTVITTAEYVRACGNFFDAVPQKTICHGGQPELDTAIRGAATRPLGEATAWSRKKSEVDITPLVSATLAHWGIHQGEEASVYNDRDLLVLD